MRSITSLPALSYFRVAAELESFSKAADTLNVTHGAISRAVRLLEDDLETSLFERRNRAVFLTDAGRRLALVVSKGLGDIEAEVRRIKEDSAKATLTVSCEPTLMMRWLIPRLQEFQEMHPEADIRLLAGGGPVTLGTGIDLAIRRNDFDWPDTYHARLLFKEKIGPICRPEKSSAYFCGEHLNGTAKLLHTRTRPNAWVTWSDLSGMALPSRSHLDFEHFYFSIQAALAGLGVAIGPWHLVQDDIRSGLLTAPNGFIEDGSGYMLLSARKPQNGTLEDAFGAWLQTVGRAEHPEALKVDS